MKKSQIQAYLIFCVALFFVLSLSRKSVDSLNGITVSFFAPVWGEIQEFMGNSEDEQVLYLTLENERLKNEIDRLGELAHYKNAYEHSESLPARVIFRSPSSWNSSFWINVGEKTNLEQNDSIVKKNSPVLMGKSVVGVIDYVGYKQSRVRLITDSGLTPSVRAVREIGSKKFYLAKGELYGSSEPLWRSKRAILKGIGFNYDFSDEYGPARDLRTGKPETDKESFPTLPIIQVDDLLVTTGMDGVFPPNLDVAVVTGINMLKEGDYFYEIEAVPTAGDLEDISLVFVIKPIGFDPLDQPPLIGN